MQKQQLLQEEFQKLLDSVLKWEQKRNTFYGLSGIGDLTLTCSSLKSRNTKLGYDMAKGKKLVQLKKKLCFRRS